MKNEEGENRPDLSNFYTQSFKTNYFEKTGPNNLYTPPLHSQRIYIYFLLIWNTAQSTRDIQLLVSWISEYWLHQ